MKRWLVQYDTKSDVYDLITLTVTTEIEAPTWFAARAAARAEFGHRANEDVRVLPEGSEWPSGGVTLGACNATLGVRL